MNNLRLKKGVAMNSFDCAIKKEKEVISLYQYLANEASLASLKRFFAALLLDGKKHLEVFSCVKEFSFDNPVEYKPLNGELHKLFLHIVNDNGIGSLPYEEVCLYREVMDNEKNVLKQYERLLDSEENEEIKTAMERVISQKKKHFGIVKDLCVLISEQQSAH
jgi:rubrerythrin